MYVGQPEKRDVKKVYYISYLAFSQIWLNLPMDQCQFGYISKLTWYSIIHGFLLIFHNPSYGDPRDDFRDIFKYNYLVFKHNQLIFKPNYLTFCLITIFYPQNYFTPFLINISYFYNYFIPFLTHQHRYEKAN